MGRKEDILERVRQIAEPLATPEGLELVDVEFLTVMGETVLRLYIDKLRPAGAPLPTPEELRQPGAGVTLDDCTNFSHVVSAALDVEDPIDGHYSLEVSSPGLDRPLRKQEHFTKYAGQKARIKTFGPIADAGNRKTFVGTLKGIEDGRVSIDVDGTLFKVPFEQISKANIEPTFDDLN